MFLKIGTGIGGMPPFVEPAFIADTDTFSVESFGVGTDLFYRSGRLYIPVFADIKMIARSVESASAMAFFAISGRRSKKTCSGTKPCSAG